MPSVSSWSSWKMVGRFLTFEECDERLRAGWHVDFDDCCDNCSAQRKRYLRSENELRLLSREREVEIPQFRREMFCET